MRFIPYLIDFFTPVKHAVDCGPKRNTDFQPIKTHSHRGVKFQMFRTDQLKHFNNFNITYAHSAQQPFRAWMWGDEIANSILHIHWATVFWSRHNQTAPVSKCGHKSLWHHLRGSFFGIQRHHPHINTDSIIIILLTRNVIIMKIWLWTTSLSWHVCLVHQGCYSIALNIL